MKINKKIQSRIVISGRASDCRLDGCAIPLVDHLVLLLQN